MARQHWLVKQEPEAYSWTTFAAEGRTAWTGIRNHQARNHLRAMKVGDWVLYYHSVSGKHVVGLARVVRTAYPDPTAREGDWSAVDLEAVRVLARPVSLAELKDDPATAGMPLIRQTRLSVMPVGAGAFRRILDMGGTRLPR